MKSPTELFRELWRRPRPGVATQRRYDAALRAYDTARSVLRDQMEYDLSEEYFRRGYNAGYNASNEMWQKKKGKK